MLIIAFKIGDDFDNIYMNTYVNDTVSMTLERPSPPLPKTDCFVGTIQYIQQIAR